MARHIAVAVLTLLGMSSSLAAQQRTVHWERWKVPTVVASPVAAPAVHGASTAGMVFAGLGGGAVGFAAGGLLGYAIGGGNLICGDDACGFEEAAYGAIIGESALLPLGVHLANRRRGSYGLSLLASAAVGGLGILAVNTTNDGAPLIVVPIAQLVTSIVIERATAH